MAFDAKKNILLEKQYFYVKAQKGFKLQGTSTEVIPTNTGFYRFLVANLTFALGNSYIDVLYDSTDASFQAYCSDLFMENVQNTVTVAVENMNVDLAHFAEQNHSDITLVATKIDTVSEDLNALTLGVGAGLKQVDDDVNANAGTAHEDAQAIKDAVENVDLSSVGNVRLESQVDEYGFSGSVRKRSVSEVLGTIITALDATDSTMDKSLVSAVATIYRYLMVHLPSMLKETTFSDFATALSTALQLLHTDNESLETTVDALGKDATLQTIDTDIKAVPSSLAKDATVSDFATGVGGALEAINTLLTAISTSNAEIPSFKSINHADLNSISAKIPSVGGLALDATLSALATALGTALQAVNTNLEAVNTGTTEIPNFKAGNHSDLVDILNENRSGFSALLERLVDLPAFMDANHTDLSALLTAFNSLAEELKKKLANFVLLDGVPLDTSSTSGYSMDRFLSVGQSKIFVGRTFLTVSGASGCRFLVAYLSADGYGGASYSGYFPAFEYISSGNNVSIGFSSNMGSIYVKRLS